MDGFPSFYMLASMPVLATVVLPATYPSLRSSGQAVHAQHAIKDRAFWLCAGRAPPLDLFLIACPAAPLLATSTLCLPATPRTRLLRCPRPLSDGALRSGLLHRVSRGHQGGFG